MKVLVRHQYKEQIWFDVEEVNGYTKTEFTHRRKDHSPSVIGKISEGSSQTLWGVVVIRSQDKD